MKQFVFKQQVLLAKGKTAKNSVGKIYSCGIHAVPEDHQKDPTFMHYAKHGLIEPYQAKEQEELKPADSDAAKQSAAVAKSQLEPDAEIGAEPEFPEDKPSKKKKER